MENNNTDINPIERYIHQAVSDRPYTSEDLVGIFTPLLMQLERIHAQNKIVLKKGLASFTTSQNGSIIVNESSVEESINNVGKLNNILPDVNNSFDIVSEQNMLKDLSKNTEQWIDNDVAEELTDQILAPVFVPGYQSYETVLGHHDPSTDIHVIGMLLASLAFGLDLRNKKDLITLTNLTKNPAYISNSVHPNIMHLILDMLQLDRRKRIRDAYTVRIRLENYQEYNSTTQEDLNLVISNFKDQKTDRKTWILSKLRNRLFDLSKRNRLIYFQRSARYVNLTISSVPNVLDYKNIRPEKLFIWNKEISSHLKSGKTIKLNKFLKISENPQITVSLKKVFYEANRDINEYGFNLLKLSFCFLNWYNYKENINEKIKSPLLLLPVSLKKKKGIKDDFQLELETSIAQVNPVLSYYLKELYDIQLPREFDLSVYSIEEIYQTVNKCITSKSAQVKLELFIKPKLRLIHSLVKKSFSKYQKKLNLQAAKLIWGGNGNYSYDAQDYRPLGLKLFRDRVLKNPSMLEFLVDKSIQLKQIVEEDVKRELFTLESDGTINPHQWEFDLCNFTLGNFNYQLMTLVNDYDSLISQKENNPVFESLFTDKPKELAEKESSIISLENNFCVIPADPSQLSAIEQSNKTTSYIIQGPPGTGKSQTIVNLLANKVAEGKSVLFISEKRAALDVVYARMEQVGLNDLCTLIHDSQMDKKSFIFDLKETYESYQKEDNSLADEIAEREECIKQLKQQLSELEKFHAIQNYNKDGISLRSLVDTLLSTNVEREDIDPKFFDTAPDYTHWVTHKEYIIQLQEAVSSSTNYSDLASCPFMTLDRSLIESKSADEIVRYISDIEKELDYVIAKSKGSYSGNINMLADVSDIIDQLNAIKKISDSSSLEIFDRDSQAYQDYKNNYKSTIQIKTDFEKYQEKNKYWKQKPSADELKRLAAAYKKISSGVFNKLLGKKQQFVSTLSQYYDFSQHMVEPEPEEILENMEQEIKLRALLSEKSNYSFTEQELNSATESYRKLRAAQQNTNDTLSDLINDERLITGFNKVAELNLNESKPINEIYDEIDDLKINTPSLFTLKPLLREWYDLDDRLKNALQTPALNNKKIEFLAALKYLNELEDEMNAHMTGADLSKNTTKISQLYPKLLTLNSNYIKEKVKKTFQDALDLSYIPSYELTAEQSKKKKQYQEARSILENEFNKKIRYKSIRDLASDETGVLINDIKPIWMMSPLSVSDTLPISEIFDIVIFDEASQITVEEGVPSLFRANKAIIVGDEKQMPPSDFFSTKVEDDDGEAEYLSMDAESLLNQGVRKLPQVTLAWHYRSKHEALINFSNFAFYRGRLKSLPDVKTTSNTGSAIEVFEKDDAKKNIEHILDRSISFHHLPNGLYVNRMNDNEAEYIAELVKELLLSEINKTIGVVAFSMQQQSNIENALTRLADQDSKFGVILDNAFTSDAQESFEGLFVKNLENVQGDERDIMILSICYGYSPKGRMLMNFGPINRRGGEKRLNVIFSRAKEHMVIVSSIKHSDITNEHNEGANFLKKYLQYSELVSNGDQEGALSILHNLSRSTKKQNDIIPNAGIITKVKNYLLERNYHVDTQVGQSKTKIHLAIKKDINQPKYDLGIIIDSPTDYTENDVLSQYYTKQQILESFGWNIYRIYASDWLRNKNLILQVIVTLLESNTESIVEEPVESQKQQLLTKSITLEQKDNDKFWTIEQRENRVNITMGKIGTPGLATSQHFDNEEEATAYYESQIEARKARGFK